MNDARKAFIDYHLAERQRKIDLIRGEVAALRPMGVASELSLVMGGRPSRGVLCSVPYGATYVFAKARTPTPEQVEPLLILLGGGVDKMQEGMEKFAFIRKKTVQEYLQRCHSIGIDRQERCLLKEAKEITLL